jgi:hypothetical protein
LFGIKISVMMSAAAVAVDQSVQYHNHRAPGSVQLRGGSSEYRPQRVHYPMEHPSASLPAACNQRYAFCVAGCPTLWLQT